MLFLLPLIAAAIVVMSRYLAVYPMHHEEVVGLLNLHVLNTLSPTWQFVGSLAGVLLTAYLIFIVNNVFRLLYQRTTLPALIYVLLTSGFVMDIGSCNLLLAMLLICIAFFRLQVAINYSKRNAPLFDFGALMTVAVVVYPKCLPLLLWTMCVPLFSGRSTLRDLSSVLTGIVTVVIFVVFGFFWSDRLDSMSGLFMQNLMCGEYIHRLPMVEVVRLGMLLVVLLVSLSHLSSKYPAMTVSQRRGLLALVSMMLFMVITLLAVPGNYIDFIYLLAFPLSFIYTHFFVSHRLAWVGNVMFFVLLGACFLTYFIA